MAENYGLHLMLEQFPCTCKIENKQRQVMINKVTTELLSKDTGIKEATGMFFWRLADLTPPLSREEQVMFRAFYEAQQNSREQKIEGVEQAFEILGIPEKRRDLPREVLIKEVKLTFWKQYSDLSLDPDHFYSNAHEIGVKMSAFNFLCRTL